MKTISTSFLFGLPVINVSYHLCYHALALGIIASSVVFIFPTQQLLVVLGDRGTQVLFGIALFIQTVALMPCIRFLMKSIGCADGRPYFLPDDTCFAGVHIYYALLSPILFVVVIVLR